MPLVWLIRMMPNLGSLLWIAWIGFCWFEHVENHGQKEWQALFHVRLHHLYSCWSALGDLLDPSGAKSDSTDVVVGWLAGEVIPLASTSTPAKECTVLLPPSSTIIRLPRVPITVFPGGTVTPAPPSRHKKCQYLKFIGQYITCPLPCYL